MYRAALLSGVSLMICSQAESTDPIEISIGHNPMTFRERVDSKIPFSWMTAAFCNAVYDTTQRGGEGNKETGDKSVGVV